MRKMVFILLSLTFIAQGCAEDSIEPEICYEGIVVGKIRSWGGGIAVAMEDRTLSTHQWQGYENVIEALNISAGTFKTGEKIYFTARNATKEADAFPISADGDESNKPLVFVLEVSSIKCPTSND